MATRLKMKAKRLLKSDDKGSDKSVDEYDTAILTKPLTTSINNLLKILQLYQNTTEEIRQYLTSECDILYECRVCRSIFRSLSNFILHKRKYCVENFSHVTDSKWFNNDEDYLDIILKESCISESDKNEKEEIKFPKKNLNSIIDGLTQKKQIDLEIENLFSSDHKENQESDSSSKCNKILDLEYIEGSNCGMFQTLNVQDDPKSKEEKMKLEIMEVHRLTEGQTAILGPDGKVTSQKPVSGFKIQDTNEKTSLMCPKCNINFSTRKTLLTHFKFKHENERIVYPCLECSETFATRWSVHRHLFNIHHKTIPEVRKMRHRFQLISIKNDDDTPTDKKNEQTINLNDQQKIDEENQAWMDNFESDNDIQMCGGCGRRFERKAALNSHSQTCQKRIIARNIINVNKQKRNAALDDKSGDKKSSAKLIRLDQEVEKKYLDKPKLHVAKKRKIGIQIRYDYNKPNDKNVSSPAVISNTFEDNANKKSYEKSNDSQKNSQSSDKTNAETTSEVDQDKSKFNLEADLLDSEVVSIPSSNSSPNKDEQDPLSFKDLQSDSDSEIEEILEPMEHSIFGNQSSKMESYEEKDRESDMEDENFENVQYKLSTINESTLKLIKLINSDIPEENLKPTLDEKMAKYVNMKKLKCIPCDLKFGNISKLRYHMASHFNWNRFRCDICSFKTYDKIDVFEHIKRDHNIIEFEKIEAVILQIPDWETTELSSEVFIPRKEIEIIPLLKASKGSEVKKREAESSSSSVSPENCIVIESNESDEQIKKQNCSRPKRKLKFVKLNSREHVTADSEPKDPLSDGQSDDARPESRSSNRSNQDPALKKMVYEVIFGQDVTITKTSVSNSVSGEEKDSVHVVPNDKRAIENFADNQILAGDADFTQNIVTIVDSKPILNESNATQSDGEDDDIYIVENEELVAVK